MFSSNLRFLPKGEVPSAAWGSAGEYATKAHTVSEAVGDLQPLTLEVLQWANDHGCLSQVVAAYESYYEASSARAAAQTSVSVVSATSSFPRFGGKKTSVSPEKAKRMASSWWRPGEGPVAVDDSVSVASSSQSSVLTGVSVSRYYVYSADEIDGLGEGYCYMSVIARDASEKVKEKLGAWPKLKDLLGLEAQAFIPFDLFKYRRVLCRDGVVHIGGKEGEMGFFEFAETTGCLGDGLKSLGLRDRGFADPELRDYLVGGRDPVSETNEGDADASEVALGGQEGLDAYGYENLDYLYDSHIVYREMREHREEQMGDEEKKSNEAKSMAFFLGDWTKFDSSVTPAAVAACEAFIDQGPVVAEVYGFLPGLSRVGAGDVMARGVTVTSQFQMPSVREVYGCLCDVRDTAAFTTMPRKVYEQMVEWLQNRLFGEFYNAGRAAAMSAGLLYAYANTTGEVKQVMRQALAQVVSRSDVRFLVQGHLNRDLFAAEFADEFDDVVVTWSEVDSRDYKHVVIISYDGQLPCKVEDMVVFLCAVNFGRTLAYYRPTVCRGKDEMLDVFRTAGVAHRVSNLR